MVHVSTRLRIRLNGWARERRWVGLFGGPSDCGGEVLRVFPVGGLVAEAFDRIEVADDVSRGGGLSCAFLGGRCYDRDGRESLRVGDGSKWSRAAQST